MTQRNDALSDLPRKAAAIARFPIPRDPDVIFFGAESGTEALLVRALFGGGGRLLLVDDAEAAHHRYLAAPAEVRVRAPRGHPEAELVLKRDRSRIEYARTDLFALEGAGRFDVGIDWGLLEHFDDAGKLALLEAFRRHLKPHGVEISAVPRDTWAVRTFYRIFSEELNFGHRELLTPAELRALFARGAFTVRAEAVLPGSVIVAAGLGG